MRQQVLGERVDEPAGVAQRVAGGGARVGDRAGHVAGGARAQLGAVDERIERALQGRRRGLGLPWRGRPASSWPSMSIVSSAICSAAAPSAIAWCTRPTTPSRPSASRGTNASCQSGRLRSSGWESSASRSSAKRSGPTGSRGIGELHDVSGDVEVLVVDPARLAEPERRGQQALAAARNPAQPRA